MRALRRAVKMGHMAMTSPPSGVLCHLQFVVFISTCFEGKKATQKVENEVFGCR